MIVWSRRTFAPVTFHHRRPRWGPLCSGDVMCEDSFRNVTILQSKQCWFDPSADILIRVVSVGMNRRWCPSLFSVSRSFENSDGTKEPPAHHRWYSKVDWRMKFEPKISEGIQSFPIRMTSMHILVVRDRPKNSSLHRVYFRPNEYPRSLYFFQQISIKWDESAVDQSFPSAEGQTIAQLIRTMMIDDEYFLRPTITRSNFFLFFIQPVDSFNVRRHVEAGEVRPCQWIVHRSRTHLYHL